MSKKDKALLKEEKAKAKLAKLEGKQGANSTDGSSAEEQNFSNKKISTKISKETKQKIKVKKEKEKKDYKLMFKEFPIKMAKEVRKIKWSGRENLTKKFVIVVLFMLFFAVLFFFIDWGLQELFAVMKAV